MPTGAAAEDEQSPSTGAAKQVSEEKKAEVEALRKQMAEANSLAEEEENSANFKEMTERLTRSRTIRRKKTEKFRSENRESFWKPSEITPVLEEIAADNAIVEEP